MFNATRTKRDIRGGIVRHVLKNGVDHARPTNTQRQTPMAADKKKHLTFEISDGCVANRSTGIE